MPCQRPETTTAIDLDAKRAAVDAALKKQKQDMVRRVYLIPHEMVGRILDYQLEHLIPSEVEAARVLLDIALTSKGLPHV